MGNTESPGNAPNADFQLDLSYLPEALLMRILTFAGDRDLLNCMLVCKDWHRAIHQATFWKIKCLRSGRSIAELVNVPPEEWRSVYYKNPYGRNLIKNPCGDDGVTTGWTILMDGGDRLRVENGDAGCKPKPVEMLHDTGDSTKNFATSYQWCWRVQVVDLIAEGCSEHVLDEIQPAIEVSEWHAARFDCGSKWAMRVTLSKRRNYTSGDLNALESLDSRAGTRLHHRQTRPVNERLKDDFVAKFQCGPETTAQWSDAVWCKTKHTFSNYGPGVRSIIFEDGSADTQFWAGHYGGKMSASSVRINMERKTSPD